MKQVLLKYEKNFLELLNQVVYFLNSDCHLNLLIPERIEPINLDLALIVYDSSEKEFCQPVVDFSITLNDSVLTDVSTTKSIVSGLSLATFKLCQGKTVGIDIKNIKDKKNVKTLFYNLLSFLVTSDIDELKLFISSVASLINKSLTIEWVNEEEGLDLTSSFPLVSNQVFELKEIDLTEETFKTISKYKKLNHSENEVLVLKFNNLDKFCEKQNFYLDDLHQVLYGLWVESLAFDSRFNPLLKFVKWLQEWAKHPNHLVCPFLSLEHGLTDYSQIFSAINSYHQEETEDVTIPEVTSIQLYWFFLFAK